VKKGKRRKRRKRRKRGEMVSDKVKE